MAKVLERTLNYRNNAVNDVVKTISCPRYMNDVYTIGTDLQDYIVGSYLELAEMNHGDLKIQYRKMAAEQIEVKQNIKDISMARLNESLWHFYNDGGPVTELPVSNLEAKEKQPFFNRIKDNFFENVQDSLALAADGSISSGKLESIINYNVIAMYINMSKLFNVDEMTQAFNQLIVIRKPFQE